MKPVSILLPASVAATAMTLSGTALAQLEEVVVTARMRSEVFTDAPVSIKAFTAADIEEAGIETPHDFIGLTPNVTIVQTQNPGNSFVTIRGVSQARNSDMPVAVLIDGVLLSNPAQLNQQLFDIEQIEVLKGPQGALYGRNAIGGAITIVTRQPGDEFEARFRAGVDSGPGYMAQAAFSGPFGDSDTLKYRASLSYSDTDGFLENTYLGTEADPYQDTSARFKLLWEPSDSFSADARFSISQIDTTALYFVINDDWTFFLPDAPTYHGINVATPNDVNDTSVPIRSNNLGDGQKDMLNASLKLDWYMDNGGTFSSITAWDDLEEILIGDAFDFRPLNENFYQLIYPLFSGLPPLAPSAYDWNQSQYLEVSSVSQEFRYTSPEDSDFRWIVGGYFIETDRFIGTGNMADTGQGVFPVYKVPRGNFPFDFASDPVNPNVSYLSDSQDNSAWAVFTQLSYDFSDKWQGTFSLRYDEDKRRQTTETPAGFIPAPLAGDLVTGQVRTNTWDSAQPKFTLRWKPQDNITVYGDISRGFRSGGFNQSGVALAGVAGVFDTFDEQIADTIEIGMKAQLNDGRINTSVAAYTTDLEGAYYFIFLVASSTQNLGSIDEVQYQGIEFELDALLGDNFELNLGLAFMDSEIKADAQIPHVVGEQVPLVSDYTFNLGGTYRKELGRAGSSFFVRADYQIVGDTYWGPGDASFDPIGWNQTVRDPYSLLDLRLGVEGEDWTVALWGKNALDEKYNGEFSHPFVWKGLPARWGLQYTKNF